MALVCCIARCFAPFIALLIEPSAGVIESLSGSYKEPSAGVIESLSGSYREPSAGVGRARQTPNSYLLGASSQKCTRHILGGSAGRDDVIDDGNGQSCDSIITAENTGEIGFSLGQT